MMSVTSRTYLPHKAPFLTPKDLLPYLNFSLTPDTHLPYDKSKRIHQIHHLPVYPLNHSTFCRPFSASRPLPTNLLKSRISGPKDTLENLHANFPIEIHSAAPRGPHCHKPRIIFILCRVPLQLLKCHRSNPPTEYQPANMKRKSGSCGRACLVVILYIHLLLKQKWRQSRARTEYYMTKMKKKAGLCERR